MTHVFVALHPDDAALSCGGLIASLGALGWPAAGAFAERYSASS